MTPERLSMSDIPTATEIEVIAGRFTRRPCRCAACEADRRLEALKVRDGRAIDARAAVVLETGWQVP